MCSGNQLIATTIDLVHGWSKLICTKICLEEMFVNSEGKVIHCIKANGVVYIFSLHSFNILVLSDSCSSRLNEDSKNLGWAALPGVPLRMEKFDLS